MPTDGAVPRASSRELSARLARASEQRPARTSASSQEAARTDVSPSLTNPRAHTPAPSLTILPLLLPSLVGEDGAPQGGRLLFSQAPRRCGFEPSLVQTGDVKGGSRSAVHVFTLIPIDRCVPSRSRGSSRPGRAPGSSPPLCLSWRRKQRLREAPACERKV